MIKYFNRDGKHNWVDTNNRFVGYDSNWYCCEWASWSTTESFLDVEECLGEDTDHEDIPMKVDLEHCFFCDTLPVIRKSSHHLDAGEMASFKLVDIQGFHAGWLHIWNCHNGYYGHGFESWNAEGVL